MKCKQIITVEGDTQKVQDFLAQLDIPNVSDFRVLPAYNSFELVSETLWMPFYVDLSTDHPEFVFRGKYADEAYGESCGDFTLQNGKEIDLWCRGDQSEEAEAFSRMVWGE